MKDQKKCACSKGKATEPKDIDTETMITPEDFGKISKKKGNGPVSEKSVEESVVMINPDAESMDSRG